MSYLKNTAGQFLYFTMVDSSDGSAITTGTVSGFRSIDGAAQGSVTGTITHKGNGQWEIALSQADINGDEVGYLFTHTSGLPVSITIVTDTKKAGDLNDLSAANVNAEVDTALTDYDAPTKAEMDAGFAALNNLSAAQVNAEVDTALADIHLDHLLAADYDPAAKPGTATALLNELVENDGGVSRFTINALEQAPAGGGGGSFWTTTEQEHLRYRLQIDGTQTAPTTDAPDQLPVDVQAIDGDTGAASFQKALLNSGVTGTVQAGSTTTNIETNLSGYADNRINNRTLYFHDDSSLAGEAAAVSTYDETTGQITVAGLTSAPVSGDNFTII